MLRAVGLDAYLDAVIGDARRDAQLFLTVTHQRVGVGEAESPGVERRIDFGARQEQLFAKREVVLQRRRGTAVGIEDTQLEAMIEPHSEKDLCQENVFPVADAEKVFETHRIPDATCSVLPSI